MSETEQKIADALTAAGIEYRAVLLAKGAISDGWEHDAWRAEFMRAGKTFAIAYKTGIGHRKADASARMRFNASPRQAYDRRQLELAARPITPPAAGVLHSLVMDDTHGATFAEWCSDYGYDTDSRKALTSYEQCQNQTADARRFFGRELFEQFAQVLQDY